MVKLHLPLQVESIALLLVLSLPHVLYFLTWTQASSFIQLSKRIKYKSAVELFYQVKSLRKTLDSTPFNAAKGLVVAVVYFFCFTCNCIILPTDGGGIEGGAVCWTRALGCLGKSFASL